MLLSACAPSDSAPPASAGPATTGAGAGGAGAGGGAGANTAGGNDAQLLTTDRTLAPTHERMDALLDPRDVEDRATMLAEGYGEYIWEAGESIEPRTLDNSAPPSSDGGTLLTRFIHLADTQLADDESPGRLAALDMTTVTDGAFRAQEGYQCLILDAAVRTANQIHEAYPLDFLITGGDNIDNGQANELDWFMSILTGTNTVECDSGSDNDLVQGTRNDEKDAFAAPGLAVPWLWVTGNHDALLQGNLTEVGAVADPTGSSPTGGTRDYRFDGAPITIEEVPSDPSRIFLSTSAMHDAILADGDGHGFADPSFVGSRAAYVKNVGESIRMIVFDTAARSGGADGVVQKEQLDNFLIPALDKAKQDSKLVVLLSHHASHQIGDGAVPGGTIDPTAITTEQLRDTIAGYPNVLMHLVGHAHAHRIDVIQPSDPNVRYWEVQTAALADYPHQMRLIEIYEHAAAYRIRTVAVDFTADSTLLEAGRKLGLLDYTSGYGSAGYGAVIDRNVDLWVPKP